MRAFIGGDNCAFENLIVKYRKIAIAFAWQQVRDNYVAEDMAQETFAAIYINKHRYDFKYSFKTWLLVLIRNKCVDYIRKNHREISSDFSYDISDDTYSDYLLNNISNGNTEDTTSHTALLNIDKKTLYAILNGLHATYGQIIFLVDIEGFSYKEAAVIMKKSVSQIKIILFRARKRLKEAVEKMEGYYGKIKECEN